MVDWSWLDKENIEPPANSSLKEKSKARKVSSKIQSHKALLMKLTSANISRPPSCGCDWQNTTTMHGQSPDRVAMLNWNGLDIEAIEPPMTAYMKEESKARQISSKVTSHETPLMKLQSKRSRGHKRQSAMVDWSWLNTENIDLPVKAVSLKAEPKSRRFNSKIALDEARFDKDKNNLKDVPY